MSKRDHDSRGQQKGPQAHAEGQHGEKTHARFLEQLHEGREAQASEQGEPHLGAHRLHENRNQQDEAERNSEKLARLREMDKGRLSEDEPGVREKTRGRQDGR